MNHTESCLFSMGRSEARQASRIVRWGCWVGATPPLKAMTGDATIPACPHHPQESILVRMLDLCEPNARREEGLPHLHKPESGKGETQDTHRNSEHRRVASSPRRQDGQRREEEEGWWEGRPVQLSHVGVVQVMGSSEDHNLNKKSSKVNTHNFGIATESVGGGGGASVSCAKSPKVCVGRPRFRRLVVTSPGTPTAEGACTCLLSLLLPKASSKSHRFEIESAGRGGSRSGI